MSDKPDMKALVEQVRAFAQAPHMQELKRQVEALQQSPPEHIRKLRADLRDFSTRRRMQLGQRGQSGVEPSMPVAPKRKGRGRPPGPQYQKDAKLILQIRAEMQRTGETKVETVAQRFAPGADGGGTEKSRTTRLAKAYRAKFGRASEAK